VVRRAVRDVFERRNSFGAGRVKESVEVSITPEQMKAARRLLGWPQAELSSRVKISLNTLAYTESGRRIARSSTLQRIKAALEDAGIEFVSEDGADGVSLRKSATTPTDFDPLNGNGNK
jgi:transcriptional regulator with XRE-family HTH domain